MYILTYINTHIQLSNTFAHAITRLHFYVCAMCIGRHIRQGTGVLFVHFRVVRLMNRLRPSPYTLDRKDSRSRYFLLSSSLFLSFPLFLSLLYSTMPFLHLSFTIVYSLVVIRFFWDLPLKKPQQSLYSLLIVAYLWARSNSASIGQNLIGSMYHWALSNNKTWLRNSCNQSCNVTLCIFKYMQKD